MNVNSAHFQMLVVVAVFIFAVLAVAMYLESKGYGFVYATWPDQECRHVEPERFSCDNLPDRFEIVWVSREWRP